MIVYKTTNLVNGKFYVGKDVENDTSYLGSGKILKQAIAKYGRDNFKKEILEYCSSIEELDERERFWIKELSAIELGYNLTEGGTGGDTWTNSKKKRHWNTGKPPWNKNKKGAQSAWNKGVKGYMGANETSYKAGKEHPFYGKKRDPEIYNRVVKTRRAKNNFKGVGAFARKGVKNIEDGMEFASIKEASEFYGLTRGQVGHSCRKQKGKFRFMEQ